MNVYKHSSTIGSRGLFLSLSSILISFTSFFWRKSKKHKQTKYYNNENVGSVKYICFDINWLVDEGATTATTITTSARQDSVEKEKNNQRMKESKQMKLIRSSTFLFNTLRSVFHFVIVIPLCRTCMSVCLPEPRHATTFRPKNCEKRFLLMNKGKLLIEETYCTKIRLQQQNPYRNSNSAQPKRSCVPCCSFEQLTKDGMH